jgi:hypothetical protein
LADASTKYGTSTTPSRSPAAGGGDEEDTGSGDEGKGGRQVRLQRHGLASQRRARAPGRRKWRWSPLEKASGGRVVGNAATAVLVENVDVFFFNFQKR